VSLDFCLSCGWCCTHFRVSFHWSEADASLGGKVPEELTVPLPGTQRSCMKGTTTTPGRCVALSGEPGVSAGCSIHSVRPSPCRSFGPNWDEKQQRYVAEPEELVRCNRVRVSHNLPPLTDEDLDPLAKTRPAA
jgi:Fe-S-cluster containining protein